MRRPFRARRLLQTAPRSYVHLGETTIVCGVKARIAEPYLEQPAEGFIGSHLLGTESMAAMLTPSLRS